MQSLGVLDLSVSELCQLIQQRRSLQRAIITKTEGYAERSGSVVHRFLVVELKREGKKLICLRLDRRRGEGVSPISLISASGVTSANDTVSNIGIVSSEIAHKTFCGSAQARLAPTKARLIKTAELENQQFFKIPPTLAKLRELLIATCEELQTYKLWPVSPYGSYLLGHTLMRIARKIVGFLCHCYNSSWRKGMKAFLFMAA